MVRTITAMSDSKGGSKLTVAELEQMSDEQLVAVAQRDERLDEVFVILVRRVGPTVDGLILSRCRNESIAEEVVQQAWVSACWWLDRYDPARGASFSTWMCAIARNYLYKLHRKEERGERCLRQMAVLCPSSVCGPAEEFRNRRAQRLAKKCMCRLSRDQQIALKMHVMQGLPYREVARRIGCNEEHCKYLVKCALRILRRQSGNLREPGIS